MTHIQTFVRSTGKHIPEIIIPNDYFENTEFFLPSGIPDTIHSNREIIDKLADKTGIEERRYFAHDMVTSGSGFLAAKDCYASSGSNPKDTNVILFAHNGGDVRYGHEEDKIDCIPNWASRIKNDLDINNPDIIACDFAIGGPHWKEDLERIKDYLAIGSNDLVVEVDGYKMIDIHQTAQQAFTLLDVSQETLHRIIVIHNLHDELCLASKVKALLEIFDPDVLAFDVLWGCGGWLHGVSLADLFITSGKAQRVMVIGAEGLERFSDPHDMNSQIYSAGAGAAEFEGREVSVPAQIDGEIFMFAALGAGIGSNAMAYSEKYGILRYMARSDTSNKHLRSLWMGESYNPKLPGKFLKMDGGVLFAYSISYVVDLIKKLIDEIGILITQVSKMFLHQANKAIDEKMTVNLFERFYGKNERTIPATVKYTIPIGLVPMTIQKYGNNSVATLPILLAEVGFH
ncbi:MAG: hypothetical protein WCL18_05455 [bacterium]